MTKVDMKREAMKDLGDVPSEALAGYFENKHGVRIDPKFVPIRKFDADAIRQIDPKAVKKRAA